jgi:peptide/nickel transport system permease protein
VKVVGVRPGIGGGRLGLGQTRLGIGGVVGLTLLALFAVVAVLSPVLAPGDPLDIVARPLTQPFTDPNLPLGTDRLGRDAWAILVHGTRVSLIVGLTAAAGALLIGVVLGLMAGFLGGRVDTALMRVTEAFQTIPTFILALALVSALGASVGSVVLAIALASWPSTARLVRGETLSLRQREYVDAARMAGLGSLSIAFREILPGALQPVISLVGVTVGAAVLVEAALAFLELSDPNVVSWGGMIADGREVLRVAPTLVLFPGLAVALLVLAVSLVGDALGQRLGNRTR